MAERGTQQFHLPTNLAEWRVQRKTLACDDMDIHNLKTAKSAPEIQNKQFLALKVFWTNQKQSRMTSYLKQIGFDEQMFEDKKEEMRARENNQSRKWTPHSSFPDELGGFQIVLRDQLEILDLDDDEDAHAGSNKVAVTPMRKEKEKLINKLRPKQKKPYAEPPETPQRPAIFHILGEMSANRKDYDGKFDDAEDEQIVNAALVNLLHALWIHEKRSSGWTMKRKEFKFHSQGTGAGFVARTDGHLQVGNKSAAILEVKARARARKAYGDQKIEMQESAQMALWIAQEPQSHWASGGSTDVKGTKAQTMFHRVLISQDRHEIYLTIAEYPQKYIDYLHNKPGVKIDDDDFALRMKLFGHFDTQETEHMWLLGILVKVILTHAANALKAPSTMGDLGQDFGRMRISKGKERAQDDPQAEMSMSDRPHSGGGGMLSQSSSRSSSPTAGVVARGRKFRADSGRGDRSLAPPSTLSGTALPHYGNDGLRPISPGQAGQRQPDDSRGFSLNVASARDNNITNRPNARPVPPHPDPIQRFRSSHRSSSTSSDETGSAFRRSRSPSIGPESATERAAVSRSISSSPLRHSQPTRPSTNPTPSARRVAASRRPPVHPRGPKLV